MAFASRNFAIWPATAEEAVAGRPAEGARPAAAAAAGSEWEEEGEIMDSGSAFSSSLIFRGVLCSTLALLIKFDVHTVKFKSMG